MQNVAAKHLCWMTYVTPPEHDTPCNYNADILITRTIIRALYAICSMHACLRCHACLPQIDNDNIVSHIRLLLISTPVVLLLHVCCHDSQMVWLAPKTRFCSVWNSFLLSHIQANRSNRHTQPEGNLFTACDRLAYTNPTPASQEPAHI